MKKNTKLRLERINRGWSQQHLADFAQVSKSTIERAERGEPLRIDNMQRICNCLEKSAKELGLWKVEEAAENIHIDTTQVDYSLNLANVSNNRNPIEDLLLEQAVNDKLDTAESIINLAWEAWFASRPQKAAKEITKLLSGLEKTMYSCPSKSMQALHSKELVIRCHGLLGTICLDSLQNDNAFFHYMQAHKFADELHDPNLTASYLTLIGDVLRRQDNKIVAISYMENARNSSNNLDKATKGHILQLLAYTYADVGNASAFESTIQEATDLLAFTGEGRDTARKEFIPFEIYEIRGKANRDLGKPLDAMPYLELAEKSLSRTEAVTPRWHALLEISRGQAFCDAGDIKQGTDLAIRGLNLAFQSQSPRQMNRVRKLLKKLEGEESPWRGHKAVKVLKEAVHETYLRQADNN